MKTRKVIKVILSLFLGILVFLLVIGGVILLCLDSIVQKAVVKFGSQMIGTKVELKSASVSLFNPKLELTGLSVGNPKDYSSLEAFSLQRLYVEIDRNSLFTNKIIVRRITVEGAVIDFEPKLTGDNNLNDLKKNIKAQTASTKSAKDSSVKDSKSTETTTSTASGKTVVIELFELKNAKIVVSSSIFQGNNINLPLPDVTIHDIGKESDLTYAQATEQILAGIMKNVSEAMSNASDAVPLKDSLNKIQEGTGSTVDNAVKDGKKMLNNIKSLF
jgi:uncharacterized protein involved in outer membrane biogenesis